MAHQRKGQLTRSPQWWKHLRSWKRVFWKKERRAETLAAQGFQRGIDTGRE